jgi:signal transduction histidine kinase/ActR/RegA family two-component response regulator
MLALAVLTRLGLEPLLGSSQPWLTFWPAAFLAAWWGNARAGVAASLGSVVIVMLWVLPPTDAAFVSAGVFTACTLGFVVVAEKARQARRAEVAANRAKDQFLAMLGHELRNPLAPITTAVELMRMRGQKSREIDVIERQVTHMTRLVDDLLDISRIVRGDVQLRKAPIELRSAVDKAIEMTRPLLERTGNPLEIDVGPGLVVDADAQRLTQVVTNLLTNAIKFSKRTTPITIRATRVGEAVRLCVIDRGSGIRPELLDRLFTPFVQEEQKIDRAAGGLGLGLAIARKLVELHGGTISAASEGEGRGTEMRVELPLVAAQPLAEGRRRSSPQPIAHRILLVDDNVDVGAMLAPVLEQWGHTVAIAHDGPQALKIAETFRPTLALLDIGLPLMDGHELARQLVARGIHVPMIAITGYGQDSDRAESARAGFSAHLVKPVDIARLGETIDAVTVEAVAA